MKKGPKKLRPSLFVRLKLHLALRRSKRTPLEIGLDAMIPASLLAEIHAKADRQKI